jgi:Tfp pilus assembly protein PilN
LAEALWGYREAGTMEDGHIAVDVGVVSRKTAFGLLRQIEATGIKVQRFEIAPDSETQDGIEIDIHGDDRRKGARRTLKAIMGVVAAAALGVGGYGAYLAYGTYKQSDALTQNIDRLHKSLRGNSATAAGSARLAEANTLYVRKLENRSALEILNTMTELVPDGIWLNTLDLDKNEITIAGRGNEVPGVIATLESSDAFKDVNFASATQREPDATADSFAISAIIETKPVKP